MVPTCRAELAVQGRKSKSRTKRNPVGDTLPGIRIGLFAGFFDGLGHGPEIGGIDNTDKTHEVSARRSEGYGEAASEIQDVPLPRGVQAVHLLENLVFNGSCHCKANLGKRILDVKGPEFPRA